MTYLFCPVEQIYAYDTKITYLNLFDIPLWWFNDLQYV